METNKRMKANFYIIIIRFKFLARKNNFKFIIYNEENTNLYVYDY